jgi:uncharacterized membrane protein
MTVVRTSRVRRTYFLAAAVAIQGLLSFAACKESTEPDPGSVSVAASNVPTSITRGQSGTVTITVVRVDPFTDPVTLSLEGAPAGLTGTFSPATLPSGTTTSTLTITPAATVAAGTYAMTVRAIGPGITDATTPLSIVVVQPPPQTIAIALASGTLSVAQGASGSTSATITRGGGYTGDVTFAVSGAPTGVTTTITPNPATSANTTVTITVAAGAATAPGTYPLTVTASGTGITTQTATITLTVPQPPSFTLALSPTTLSVVQDASGTSTATITRSGGFAGTVDLSVTGAPSGMTVTMTPSSVTGTTATITVTPGATVAPGNYTLTIQGTGAGVTAKTATIVVTVTGAPTTATYAFCPDLAPVWLAVQDGNGPWTRVTPDVNNSYTFQVSSGRGAIAYVTTASGTTNVTVLYATAGELRGSGGTHTVACTPPTGKTVNGSVTGLGPISGTSIDAATIVLGPSTASANATTPTFQLKNVPNGAHDLIAARTTTTISGTDFTSAVNRLIIRRALDPADGSTLPVLDFGSAESFAPATANVTIANLGADQAFTSTALSTANGSSAAFSFTSSSTGATQAYYGVPDAKLIAGDIHVLSVIATPQGASPTTSRFASLYFRSVTDRTVTLGPVLGVPTISTIATSPYLRLRAQLPLQAEYNNAGGVSYSQGGGPNTTWSILMTAAYASGAAYDLNVPDLSGVAGWNNAWALVSGVSTSYSAFEVGGTFNQFFPGQVAADGATSVFATRSGTVP